MEPNRWPVDPASLAELVACAVLDIDEGSHEERNALLFVLLSAAWGDSLARDQ